MKGSDSKRREQLGRTWQLMADAVLRSLEADTPSAATLEAARKFLADNNCTAESLVQWRGGLGFDPARLPTFDDDDMDQTGSSDSNGTTNDPALKVMPPFAPAEDDA